VASADFKSVGPAFVGSVGGFDSLALPPLYPGGGSVNNFVLWKVSVNVQR